MSGGRRGGIAEGTHEDLAEDRAEAGEAKGEEPHAEGPYEQRRDVLEGEQPRRVVDVGDDGALLAGLVDMMARGPS